MALILLRQIVSLLVVMACGFALVKCKALKSEDSRSLSVLSIYLILPCVLIKSFQIDLTPEVRNGFLLAMAASVLVHAVLLPLTALLRKPLKLDPVEQCSAIYSNAGNLVLPLVISVLGEEWVIYASAFLCVQQVFLWTHAQTRMSGARGVNWKKLLQNVNIISIIVGLFFLVTGLRLPDILYSAVSNVASTIGPVSMVMIGMLLARVDFKAVLADKRVYLLAFLRLILMPTAVLLALKLSHLSALMPDGDAILYVTYLACISPAATTITQMAQFYDQRPEHASAINVVTTLLCVATMPLMTLFFTSVI